MKSNISIKDAVPNKDRKFGSAQVYYPTLVHLEYRTHRALFTESQIMDAIARAEKNPEDWPRPVAKPGLWQRAKDLIGF